MANRPEHTISLAVPHDLRPGDHLPLPHWTWTEHLLVLEADGQDLRVTRWSWWHDRAYPWAWRMTHRRRPR